MRLNTMKEDMSAFGLVLVLGGLSAHLSDGFSAKRIDSLQVEQPFIALHEETFQVSEADTEPPPSGSELGVYRNGAVASDMDVCSTIGADILRINGSITDATVASLFCLGVVVQESMGIGGGFFLTYYDGPTKTPYVLDAREAAPAAAYEDMYDGDETLSAYGGLAVAVPGEVRGYWEFYQRFGGRVPWADLIEPSIALCEEGFVVSSHMANSLEAKKEHILNETTMSSWVNSSTGDVYKEGDIIKRPDLANTLRAIQVDPDTLYSGALSQGFLDDLSALGSIITREDLESYQPKWRTPVKVSLYNGELEMYSVPPPASGAILGFILNVLDNYNFTVDSLSELDIVTTNQRITETFKYAYARRTELGDEDFVDMTELVANLTSKDYGFEIYSNITDTQTSQDPEYYGAVIYSLDSHGTSHLSLWSPDGSAVAVTSTINLYFGAVIASTSTGIVLNDEMDDFSSPNITNSFGLPPSPSNFIEPGKRPVSSMCPAIFTDRDGNVRLTTGAAGGSMISSATSWTAMQNLWFGKSIKEAIDARRIHHQLFPMTLSYETDYRMDVIQGLEAIGHETAEFSPGESVVNGIALGPGGLLNANSDFRKDGAVDGF